MNSNKTLALLTKEVEEAARLLALATDLETASEKFTGKLPPVGCLRASLAPLSRAVKPSERMEDGSVLFRVRTDFRGDIFFDNIFTARIVAENLADGRVVCLKREREEGPLVEQQKYLNGKPV